ncbi:MAG: hypothetical protein ACXWZW_12480 [Solirubrobacterales bacterium]
MEQRATWTDERLDDLAEAMRSGFARIDQDIHELRSEVHAGDAALRAELREGFASLRTEIRNGDASLRGEIQDGDASLRGEIQDGEASLRAELGGEIRSLRNAMFAFGGGTVIALIGVIGAILARGA